MSEPTTYRNALPLDSMLLEYRLESVLGAGAFGMTYLGWDTNLEKHVAIKEYLPGELSVRALDGSVVPANTEHEYNYKWGLDRFIQEARTLARFSHPNIVRVNRFFAANGTSYMVMEYEAGQSLYQHMKRLPTLSEGELKSIVMPILDGMQAVHQAGFLHRDIKPSNVFIRANGTPVLLDFGSARQASGSMTKNLTAIVTPGYAPIEQYTADGNQGPWSDIYALAGVMYRAVTGETPPEALKRMKLDAVPSSLSAARARYDGNFLEAIEWGMALDEKNRPQNAAEWREHFAGGTPVTALARGNSSAAMPTPRANSAPPAATPDSVHEVTQKISAGKAEAATQRVEPPVPATSRRGKWGWICVLVCVFAIAIIPFVKQRAKERALRQEAAAQAQLQTPGAQPDKQILQSPDAADSNRQPALPAQAESNDSKSGETSASTDDEAQIPPGKKKEFMSADSNGDGFLSPDEVAGRFPFIAKKFALVDTDHDGRISLDEFWQLRKKQQEFRQRR